MIQRVVSPNLCLSFLAPQVLTQVTRLLALADPTKYSLPEPAAPEMDVRISAAPSTPEVVDDEEPLVQMVGEDSSKEEESAGEQFLAFKP